jgi:hypothetical protein
MTAPTIIQPNRVDQPNAAVARNQEAVTICRDLAGGTMVVRAAGTRYLPQNPGETDKNYAVRLAKSVLFNGFLRTVRGLTGMVFRRDPTLEADVPKVLVEHAENIDLDGTHLAVFAKEVFEDIWVGGYGGILVDVPPVTGRRTRRQERVEGVRPYWKWYPFESIRSWRYEQIGGRRRLTQVVLQEIQMVPDGEFGEREDVRYRVLRREASGQITYQLYRKAVGSAELVGEQAPAVIRNVTEIPFVPIPELGTPPSLLDLAYVNITHYQVHSDRLQSMHKAGVPIFVRIGYEQAGGEKDAPIVVGPNTAMDIPIGGDAKYVEHAGTALGEMRQELQDLKADMAVLGLSMLMHETRAAETFEAKRIDKAEQDSALATKARRLQDGMEAALQFHAEFLGLPSGGSYRVNREFERLQLTGQDIEAYAARVRENQLSLETLWDIMARAGHLPEDFDADVERDRIEQGAMLRAPADDRDVDPDDEPDNED